MIKKVAMILGAALLFAGCKNVSKEGASVQENTKGQSYTFKTIKAAVDMGLTLKCSYVVNDVSSEGYVKGKQWRGKMQHPQYGVSEILMLEDGCMYSWQEGNDQGFKTCLDPEELWKEADTPTETDTDIEYKCSVAIVDDSTFTPPSYVNFVDPMDMVDQMQMGM